jgi:hypothetical protein
MISNVNALINPKTYQLLANVHIRLQMKILDRKVFLEVLIKFFYLIEINTL